MSDVRNMMLEDSKDLLDNVEVTTVAQECVKLKQKEDEIAALEEQLKSKKLEADDISSRVIPELLAEQGLSEIKLADGSKVAVKKEFRCTLPKDEEKPVALTSFPSTYDSIYACLPAHAVSAQESMPS